MVSPKKEETNKENKESNVYRGENHQLISDYTDVFNTHEWFASRESLIHWVRSRGIDHGMVIVVGRSEIGSEERLPRLVLCCERSGYYREGKKKPLKQISDSIEDDFEEGYMERGEKISTKEKNLRTGSKKLLCPFQLKGCYLRDIDEWSLEVVCAVHNHALAEHFEGHAYLGRLSSDEAKLVATLSSTHNRPTQILGALQTTFPDNRSTIKTIYNVRTRNRFVDHGGRSHMQYLLTKLEEHKYYQMTRRCQQTNTLEDLFYAHPTSVRLLRAFPHVLLMDCTYKTNRYRLPLLEIVGVTSTNMTFSVACAYLHSEKEDSYTWALNVLKGLMDERALPTVIVTDRETALMNAIETTFPTSRNFLCRWHINKNITANCKKKFEDGDDWKDFLSAWNAVVLADTKSQYDELLRRFKEDYASYSAAVDYAIKNWITPYKERFVSAWTNNVMHYDNTTTCRVEGQHARLKKFLGSNTGNLETCWEKMHVLLETSFNAVKASFEKSLNVVMHRYKSPIFQIIRGMVSIAALDKVLDEVNCVGENVIDPLLCGCVLRKKCGLPCAHEIYEHKRSSLPLSLENVDSFWRKMDMEPLHKDKVDVGCDIRARFSEIVCGAQIKFDNVDEFEQLLMLKRMKESVNPCTTLLIEPEVQTRGRGRPKNTKTKQATSTKREKSAFEYVDSCNATTFSQMHSGFECDDTSLSSHVMFTTRPKKQKVVRCTPPIEYIDQIATDFRSHVLRTEDVMADGHCGFRAIAGLLLGNEDLWKRIRCDLMTEINKNPELWSRCFLEHGRLEQINDILNCFDEPAPLEHWFVLPEMGHLVATVYKVVLVTLGGHVPITYLPLTSVVPPEPNYICIASVKLGKVKNPNHFIRVFLSAGHPFPPVSRQWKENCTDCAKGWEDLVR